MAMSDGGLDDSSPQKHSRPKSVSLVRLEMFCIHQINRVNSGFILLISP